MTSLSTMRIVIIPVVLLFMTASCDNRQERTDGDWIIGTDAEKLKIIEQQFRGFDNAMVETDYRYRELYWAGQDQNWEYATYQLGKIKVVIERGLQRRPKRARSSKFFLDELPAMQKSIDSKDTATFNKGFLVLTTHCNNCHTMEKMPFFTTKPPVARGSSIRK